MRMWKSGLWIVPAAVLLAAGAGKGLAVESSWRFVAASLPDPPVLTSGTPQKSFLVETMGGGICVLDYDGDSWPDLFFSNGTTREHWNKGSGPSDRLLRNLGDGRFADVTDQAGLRDSGWGMGCVAADYDNDGDVDLYVTNYGKNVLYRNNGDGTFKDVTGEAGVGDPRWSTGAAFGDYDRDGDLDLYVANYVDFDFEKPGGDPRFCSYRGVTVACGPRGLAAARDTLYRNEGNGTFRDVSAAAGILSPDPAYGFQVIWTDFDRDGDLDLFVANDSTPNFLFRNDGRGSFEEEGLLLGLAYNQEGRAQANMGADIRDIDGDGWLDLYSTNFSDDYNVLYRDSGKMFFQDVSYAAKTAEATIRFLGFGALIEDFDNDGWPDLFAANGHIYPEVERHGLGSEYKQANQLFKNLGKGLFQEIGAQLGPGLGLVKSSRGAAALDWDQDGDIDLAVSNMDEAADLLRNDLSGGGGFIEVYLRGHKSNRAGIGARVTLRAGGVAQTQELHAGSGFLGNCEAMLHFGLGAAAKIDSLEILWPSGTRQVREGIAPNTRIVIEEEP